MGQQFTDGIIGSFIFQSYLKAVLYGCFLNRYSQLCVLLVVLLVTAEVDFRFQRADIQRVSHACLVLLVVLHQLTRSIGLERTEQGNTFLTVAFGGQIWNIQYARPVVNRKVKAFHHTALNECVHEEVIPATLLCQQIAFKLATAFSFQFQKRAFFLIL